MEKEFNYRDPAFLMSSVALMGVIGNTMYCKKQFDDLNTKVNELESEFTKMDKLVSTFINAMDPNIDSKIKELQNNLLTTKREIQQLKTEEHRPTSNHKKYQRITQPSSKVVVNDVGNEIDDEEEWDITKELGLME